MTMTIILVAAFAIFTLGNIYRAVRILRTPPHLRWDLYPIPKGPREKQRYGGSYFEDTEWWTKSMGTSRRGELTFMLKEVFFLRGVFENFRALWVWSLLLHWALYLYIAATGVALVLGIVIGTMNPRTALGAFGWPYLGYALACTLGIVGGIGLIYARAHNLRLKAFSSRATLFNLGLLTAIFTTGLVALLTPDRGLLAMVIDLPAWRQAHQEYAAISYVHLGLIAFFLVYFPFTHMTHMYMKYFTWHGVRWDDKPSRFENGSREKIAENLRRRVSWRAPHIQQPTEQAWVDVAGSTGHAGKDGHD